MKNITIKVPDFKRIMDTALLILLFPFLFIRKKIRVAKRRYQRTSPQSKKMLRLKLGFVAVCTVAIMATVACVGVYAKSNWHSYYTVEYKTVMVYVDDTVWGIAEEYKGDYPGDIRQYVYEILKENNVENTKALQPGTELRIPVYTLTE